jgi:transcriptional regulator with XRE-family HTH domain
MLTAKQTNMIAKDTEQTNTQYPIVSPLAVRLSRNISMRRHFLGLTQAQLAERLGVETETLSRFERGKTVPSLEKLERLADVLLTTISELLSERPKVADDDAIIISSFLYRLPPKDRKFALGMLKQLCEYLEGHSSKEQVLIDECTEVKN